MSVLDRKELEQSPLADLHAIASELGLEDYRRLRKEDLIKAILKDQGDSDRDSDADDEGDGHRDSAADEGGGGGAEPGELPERARAAEAEAVVERAEGGGRLAAD